LNFLGASWEPLGSLLEPLGAILGRLGAKFELLGSLLGASWEPLGASWSLLGRSWAVLGQNCVVLGRLLGHFIFLMIFWSDFGSKKGAQREAFWEPKRSKNRYKKECKIKSEKVTSWSRLGAILGRFPRRLEVKNVDFSLVFKAFREHPCF
jgi:hypothetical protein